MAVRRTRVSDLLLFAQETKHHQRFASPIARTGSPKPKSEPKVYLDSYQEWHQALNDALESWVPHKRQSLAMGLAAYGLRGLRLPPEVVKEGIGSVATAAEDEELKRRLQAFTRTLEKFNKGHVVTWHRYYLEAGVDPPNATGISDAVAAKLPLCKHILDSYLWSGSSWLSDRSVYTALYSLACEFGKDHEQGIAVSIDVRTLALKAGLSDATRNKALKRLHKADLVKRDHEAKKLGRAGVLLLLLPQDNLQKLHHSSPTSLTLPNGRLYEWGNLGTHPAFSWRRLNKVAGLLLTALLKHDQPMTRAELAKAVGRKSRGLKVPLERLQQHGIVVAEGELLKPSEDWQAALDKAAQVTGALQAQEKQRAQHMLERDLYQQRHMRGKS